MNRSREPQSAASASPPPVPDAGEWDFRSITEDQLWSALEYEYVRSSAVKDEIDAFHREPFNSIPFTDQLPRAAFEGLWNDQATVGDAIRAIWDSPLMDDFEGAVDCGTFLGLLGTLLPLSVRQALAGAIATRYHDLAIPFVQLEKKLGKKAFDRRLLANKEPESGLIWSPHAIHGVVDQVSYPTHQRHSFVVNWGFSDTALRKEFEEWLRTHRPTKESNQAGPASTQERLKQLAAFRLSSAGITYRHARRVLEERRKFDGAHLNVYPLYSTQSAWDVAAGKAEALLKGDFIREIREVIVERRTS